MHPQYVAGDLGHISPRYAVDPSSELHRSPRKACPRIYPTSCKIHSSAYQYLPIGTHHVVPTATLSPGTIFGAEVTPNTPDYARANITAPQQRCQLLRMQAYPFEIPPPEQTHLCHPKLQNELEGRRRIRQRQREVGMGENQGRVSVGSLAHQMTRCRS
ncbi:hypothetical protein BDR03DRAFT_948999 [Suillus americanus]|nr:hypothetical protein BDR03DRAFT_948999 [Suillus americanus]